MDIRVYDLPTIQHGFLNMKHRYEFLIREKKSRKLSIEENDYVDYCESILDNYEE